MLVAAHPSFDINSITSGWTLHREFERPLNAALRKKNLLLVDQLIQKGAWVNPPFIEDYEANPLYQAWDQDNLQAIELLLAKGACPDHLCKSRTYYLFEENPARPVLEFIRKFLPEESKSKPHSYAIFKMVQLYSKSKTD